MPPVAAVPVDLAVKVLKKYIAYFADDEFPQWKSEVWKKIANDPELEGKWSIGSVRTNVREDRRGILSEARRQCGITFEIEGLDQEQDALQNDDSNQFTEVIYVEEKRNKSPKHGYLSAKTPKSLMSAENTPKKKYKRNNSDLSDERSFNNCNSATPDQLDSFLLYIKSLLLQTSPELSMKLQMEILNVVMRAKINEAQSNTSLELSSNGGKCTEEADKVIVTEAAGASASGDS